MNCDNPKTPNLQSRILLMAAASFLPLVIPARGQDSSGEGAALRGNRGEIAITVRDSSGEPIPIAVAVKLFHEGIPVVQATTSNVHAFFITPTLGTLP